jgi:branched-chain amino acid transport system substrate-binding protein
VKPNTRPAGITRAPTPSPPSATIPVYVLADSLKRAGATDGPKLRAAIAATKNFSGVSGVTTIDKDRNASKPATIIALKDGKATFFKTVAP